MQLQGATPLELKIHNTLLRVESELPASELTTTIAVALSEASKELQRLRKCARDHRTDAERQADGGW